MIFTISCSSVNRYAEYENEEGEAIETGIASWYGPNFHGKLTANGEVYDMYELTAAHKTLPFNSIVRVVNLSNRKSVIVRINDRGPFIKNRIIDLSKRAAEEIDMIQVGFSEVEIRLLSAKDDLKFIDHELYTIQIGSFRNKTDASIFGSKFNNTKIVEANIKGETYYRVYYGEYKNLKDAENDQQELKGKGVECFIKQLN